MQTHHAEEVQIEDCLVKQTDGSKGEVSVKIKKSFQNRQSYLKAQPQGQKQLYEGYLAFQFSPNPT